MVDPDLIAYLDQRFRESAEQFAAVRAEAAEFRQETTQQLAAVRSEAAEFRQETTRQFAEVRSEAAEFRQETTRQFAEMRSEASDFARQLTAVRSEAAEFRQETAQRFQQVEDTARQTLVLVEGLHSDINLLAEGFGGLNERLERMQKEVSLLPGQIKVWIDPYLKNLDGRVRILEGRAEIRPPGPQAQ